MRKCSVIAIAGGIAFVSAALIFPEVIYDNFIWRYFIGPVVADAVGHSVSYHGVAAVAGYTLLSETIYGAILLVMFYLLYKLFQIVGIQPDFYFFVGAFPFILLGATLRVLEDSGLFTRPLSYFFISPLIYAQIGLYFIGGIAVGLIIRRKNTFRQQWETLAIVIVIMIASYSIAYVFAADFMKSTMHPGWMVVFGLVSFGCFQFWKHKKIAATLFSIGVLLLLISMYFIGSWIVGNQWDAVGEVHLSIVPMILGLTCGVIVVVYMIGLRQQIPWLVSGINLSLIFGHMIDGWTSYLAVVDPLNMGISYGEKHPIPLFLMEVGNGIAYPLVKLLVVIIIIFGIDVYLKEDLGGNTRLTNLVKFFVLILGLSPGLRDVLRISMGI